jgi:hypothetical protein
MMMNCAIDIADETLLHRKPAGVLKQPKQRASVLQEMDTNKSCHKLAGDNINDTPRKTVRINEGKPTDGRQECVGDA